MRQMLGNQGKIGKQWNIGTEQEFIQEYENTEAYTTLYSFYNLPTDTEVITTRNEEFLKECGLCFDRLIFDLDNKQNPFDAIEQAIELRDFFKSHFDDLDMEIWYSGSKGAHVYIYFEPINVKNPKLIYARIFDRLKNDLGFNYIDSALKNTYAGLLRVKNSTHPSTGYHKVNLTQVIDMGMIHSMEDIYIIAQNPTVSFPRFNHDTDFISFILDLDKDVTNDDANYNTNNKYITSNTTEPLKQDLLSLWKPGQRDKVSYPLLHSLYRAGKTEQECIDFFTSILPESEYMEIIAPKIRAVFHNPLMHKVGIPTLKRNWSECGGDTSVIDEYFTITSPDSIFYPYKPPIVDDSNLELPDGWTLTECKSTKFIFKKKDVIVWFKDNFLTVIVDGSEKINRKFDKRSLSTISKDSTVPEMELESLYEYTSLYKSNRENEFTILSRELNERLTKGQAVKTAQTVANYFKNRRAFMTPKGTVMLGTDNIGRFVDDDTLKELLYDEFQPSQLITSNLLEYIGDLPKINPNYNMLRCANGFFDFNTGKFSTQANEPLVILKESPYNYRPELIDTPVPDDLQLLFDNLHNATPKSLLQVMGYSLTDGNPLKVVPIFIGPNNAGKSVIEQLTGALLNNNISSVNIFNIKDTDYGLIKNDLNLISEFTGTSRSGLALLKRYSGNEPMEFRLLYYNNKAFEPESISKTIISTNNLTDLTQYTDRSTFPRFTCYIEFKKSYKGEPDTGILDRILYNPDAMDWLLTNAINEWVNCNMELEAIHSLIDTKKMIQEYDNPIRNMLLDKYEYITPSQQYAYASEHGHTNMEDREFIIKQGVPVTEIQEFYEAQGEVAPKQLTRVLKEFFDDNSIVSKPVKIGDKPERYIIGLIRK